MKKIIYLGFSLSFGCSDGEEILGSCFVSPDSNIICTEEYNPVCACNNLVYGNSCGFALQSERLGFQYFIKLAQK